MYSIGSGVSWYSYGHNKKGIVVAVIPEGEVVLKTFRPSSLLFEVEIESKKPTGYSLGNLSKACMNNPRDEESYLVAVGNALYWPKNNVLK